MPELKIAKPGGFIARPASRLRALAIKALRLAIAGCWRFKAACDSARLSLDECATRRWLLKLSPTDRQKLTGVFIELQSVDGLSSKEWMVLIARERRFRSKTADVEQIVRAAAILHRQKARSAKPEIQIENN